MNAISYFNADDEDEWVTRFLAVFCGEMPAETLCSLEVLVRMGRLTARVYSENTEAGNRLSATDMDLLAALMVQGQPFRAKPSTLAAWAGVTNGTMTARIDRVQKRGLVRRSIDKDDRRVRWITLTKAGMAVAKDQARMALEHPLFGAIDNLPQRDKQNLARILRKLN